MGSVNKRLGLVLEGGGAKGAYQAGVLKVLSEAGYKFDGVAGTSVGALNGVMVAQNRLDDSIKIWNEIDFDNVLNIDNEYGANASKKIFDQDTLKYFYNFAKKIIGDKGLDTSKIKNIIRSNVDEDLLRNSGIDFGIMTFSLTEVKPQAIFVEDMPEGKVADYVMASASFPGFKTTVVDGQQYIDGGVYDNMPINMLLDKGYRDVIAIKTKLIVPKRRPKDSDCQILYIEPSEKPGGVMNFAPESTERAFTIGYYDALKLLNGYIGSTYYINVEDKTPFGYGFYDFPNELYAKIADIFGEIFESMSDLNYILTKELKLRGVNFADNLISMYEKMADLEKLERLKIYTLDEFMQAVCDNIYKIPVESGNRLFKEIKLALTIQKYYNSIK